MSEYPEHQEFIDMILGIKKQPTASNKEDDTHTTSKGKNNEHT
jgi:hypothetical protein